MTIIDVASAGHGAEVAVDWVLGEVLHDGVACPGWHPWNEAVYGPLPERQVWKWTCQECSDTGAMPADALQRVHDCKSRGPFDEVARLLVELVPACPGCHSGEAHRCDSGVDLVAEASPPAIQGREEPR